eukprot:Lankesteria_metandrocarpae@DN9132_c0_g1_i1.p1
MQPPPPPPPPLLFFPPPPQGSCPPPPVGLTRPPHQGRQPPPPFHVGPTQPPPPATPPAFPPPPPPPFQSGKLNPYSVNSPTQRNGHYCAVCDIGFYTAGKLKAHKDETHIHCTEPACSYSAPPAILLSHQLKHLKGPDGAQVGDTPEENAAWVASRKARYPRAFHNDEVIKAENVPTSELEKHLRTTLLGGNQDGKRKRRRIFSAFVPKLENMAKLRLPVNIDRTSSNRTQSDSTDLSKDSDGRKARRIPPHENFNICEHFLKKRACRYGDACHQSHDVEGYRNWEMRRNLIGLDIPHRPPLLYRLLIDDIERYEEVLLECFQVLVKNNFWLTNS